MYHCWSLLGHYCVFTIWEEWGPKDLQLDCAVCLHPGQGLAVFFSNRVFFSVYSLRVFYLPLCFDKTNVFSHPVWHFMMETWSNGTCEMPRCGLCIAREEFMLYFNLLPAFLGWKENSAAVNVTGYHYWMSLLTHSEHKTTKKIASPVMSVGKTLLSVTLTLL